jgi:hypothetical protein
MDVSILFCNVGSLQTNVVLPVVQIELVMVMENVMKDKLGYKYLEVVILFRYITDALLLVKTHFLDSMHVQVVLVPMIYHQHQHQLKHVR